MALPPGQLTFGQIRDLALRRLGNPGSVADAGTILSQILFELYTGWEWPFLNFTAFPVITGPTFFLPPDFLKTSDDRGLTITSVDNTATFSQGVNEVDPFTFSAVSQPTSLGVPQIWSPDRQAGIGNVFPNPTGHIIVTTLRYKYLPTGDVSAPSPSNPNSKDAIIPQFPYHLYLIQALFCEMLKYENDPRQAVQESLRDKQFTLLRQGAQPLGSQVTVIPLDDDIFGATFSGDGAGEDV